MRGEKEKGDSKIFAVRTNIYFVRPGIGRLSKSVEDSACDRIGRNHRFRLSLGFAGAEFGRINLSVNDDVNNVNPLRVELARKALSEHTQPAFGNGQRRKTGPAAQCGGGAGE